MDWRIRRRTRLKNKEVRALAEEIAARTGVEPWPEAAAVEVGEAPDMQVVFADNEVRALVVEGEAYASVKGLLAARPSKGHVTVDMGAVRFVTNGADVMGPGIVDADAELAEGDWCWIRDERNLQPLAVGRALRPGPQMRQKGKSVRMVHHVGDKLWNA